MFPFPSVLRATVGRSLERGIWHSLPARGFSQLWSALAEPTRPVMLPARARVIGVGGATLGGSYKTPLVVALAEALEERASVAVVASSYGARRTGSQRVPEDASPAAVGDEAVWLTRELAPRNIPVFVGKTRAHALELAAGTADIVLVDGLLQARPRPLHRSLLVLDAGSPWGAGRCPPQGDLRASRPRLLGAADGVVLVGRRSGAVPAEVTGTERPYFWATSRISGARVRGGPRMDLAALRDLRVGVILAIGRPRRILDALRQEGIRPASVILHADHAWPTPGRRAHGARVDAWLTSAKCATKLGPELGDVPVCVLEHRLWVDAGLVDFVACPDPPVRLRVSPVGRAAGCFTPL